MKRLIKFGVAALLAATFAPMSHSQGYVGFRNGLTARITNSVTGEPIYGPSAFLIGLYVGPTGSTEAQLSLVGLATNAPSTGPTSLFAGLFNGGDPFYLPSPYDGSAEIAFQIKVWTFSDGTSYEAALASGDPDLLIGKSVVGFVTPASIPMPPSPLQIPLFGVGPGQVQSLFVAPVPEPSTLALAGLAAFATIVFFGLRKIPNKGPN